MLFFTAWTLGRRPCTPAATPTLVSCTACTALHTAPQLRICTDTRGAEDGITWWGGDVDAFNNSVDLVDGAHLQLQRRERPELLHDAETGHPFALISGVSPGWQGDQTFTLIQPVAP